MSVGGVIDDRKNNASDGKILITAALALLIRELQLEGSHLLAIAHE